MNSMPYGSPSQGRQAEPCRVTSIGDRNRKPQGKGGQSGQVKTSLRSQCLIFTIFTRFVNFASPLRSTAQRPKSG